MRIDHIGYAVKNIEKAKNSFESLGYSFEDVVDDTDRNILILFGENGGYRIELVCPKNSGETSVDHFLKKIGPIPYHICYKSDNIEEDITSLEQKKFKVIVPLSSAIAFGGKRVVFMMNRAVGMIEIVEE